MTSRLGLAQFVEHRVENPGGRGSRRAVCARHHRTRLRYAVTRIVSREEKIARDRLGRSLALPNRDILFTCSSRASGNFPRPVKTREGEAPAEPCAHVTIERAFDMR